jgi:hypothetical protein
VSFSLPGCVTCLILNACAMSTRSGFDFEPNVPENAWLGSRVVELVVALLPLLADPAPFVSPVAPPHWPPPFLLQHADRPLRSKSEHQRSALDACETCCQRPSQSVFVRVRADCGFWQNAIAKCVAIKAEFEEHERDPSNCHLLHYFLSRTLQHARIWLILFRTCF